MALNFPDSPTLNQVYTDTTSGFSYQWDGVVWQSYTPASSNQIKIVDNISESFNGSTQIFSLAVSGTPLFPAKAQQLRVVLGGIIQEPETDYTVSNSNIIFTTSPVSGLDCSIISLGSAVPINTIDDGTVLPEKLSTGAPSWNTDGDVYISGITTIADVVKVGVGTTALIVEGNARVTGILTVGSSSITLDGDNNTITVGSGVTISASTGLTGSGANLTSLNASNLSSGTVPDARFPATLPSASGANLTSLNAGNISTGTLAIARGGTNSTSTPTQGGAAYGTGSAFAFTSAGSSGQVLTSNGTSAPTWQDAAGGGWNFIGSITANDSTSVSFTSGIDSTYDTYVVVGTGITAPYIEGNFLGSRYSTNSGSSYISTDDYNLAADFFQEILGQGVTEPVPFNLISVGIGDTTIYTNTNTCFTNWYFNLNSSTKAKICNSESITVAGIGGTYILREEYSSGLTTSSAVNAIEFLMDTGNISSGTFNLYGISNS